MVPHIFVTVKKEVPDLKAVYLPPGGCGFYGAVIQLEKTKEGVQDTAIALLAFGRAARAGLGTAFPA